MSGPQILGWFIGLAIYATCMIGGHIGANALNRYLIRRKWRLRAASPTKPQEPRRE